MLVKVIPAVATQLFQQHFNNNFSLFQLKSNTIWISHSRHQATEGTEF